MTTLNFKDVIARRAAEELQPGEVVNLGIGIPTKVINFLGNRENIYLHSENGILGAGPDPSEDETDENLVNAGKMPITELTGASFFDSAQSFAMIRGGHIHVAILGALQVNEKCLIANWAVPGKTVLGVGGAMDLLIGAKRKIITMTHTTREGKPKIVKECSYPLSGIHPVDKIITELAVFSVKDNRLILEELIGETTLTEVKDKTEAAFIVSPQLS